MVPVLAPILAPYITGGIATLGAGMYAAQPYIQKAVDDYINRSVTPTGEGGIVDAYPGTQTGLQDWTTAYGEDELNVFPNVAGPEWIPSGQGDIHETPEGIVIGPPADPGHWEWRKPVDETPSLGWTEQFPMPEPEEKWKPPTSPEIDQPITETFPLPEPKTVEDYTVYNKADEDKKMHRKPYLDVLGGYDPDARVEPLPE